MAEISDQERGLDDARVVSRTAVFPSVEKRQAVPNLEPGETIESRADYSREPAVEPITSRGLAKLPIGLREWTIRDDKGNVKANWVEPIYPTADTSETSSEQTKGPARNERSTTEEERGTSRRGIEEQYVKPQPTPRKSPKREGKRQSAPPTRQVSYEVSIIEQPTKELVLDPKEEERQAWERRTRRLTPGEWESIVRYRKGVHAPGEEDDVTLFYLALKGVISAKEHRTMQSKAIGESMKAFFVNSMSLSKLGAPLEELKEKLGFEERRGYIDFGEFYAVCGKLRPIDELRRENNRAFSKAFDDKVPKHMDTDEIILDYFWRNVIIDEAYRLSMISASKEK